MLGLLHRRQIDDLVGHLIVDDAAVWCFDEAVLIDPAERREAVDQADVRPFGSLDRADPAIMGRMNVANFEAGALPGKTARPERRHAALVGHFGQRVGLIHELRQLRRAEEFAYRGHRRLGVDQIVRHHRRDVDRAHPLLDRTLHAQQPDAILILEQFADRTDAAVGEIVDIVDLAFAVLQIHQLLDDRDNVLAAKRGDGILGIEAEAHVELDPANRRQIVALGVEEQAVEQSVGGLARRRLAGAHHAIDIGQRAVALFGLVGLQRVADPRSGVDIIDVEQLEPVGPGLVEHLEILGRNFVTGFDVNLAGLLVDQVERRKAAVDFLGRDDEVLEAILGRGIGLARGDLFMALEHHFATVGVDHVMGRLLPAPRIGDVGDLPAVGAAHIRDGAIEGVEDLLARQAERVEQGSDRKLALAIDANVDDVLGVEFEIEP